jgi:carbamoyltransferase
MRHSSARSIILGISAYYHDSAAALVIDGQVVAAAHEERFTRKKHDDRFPREAIRFVLSEYGLKLSELDGIVFYDKPYIKFERLLETYHAFAPRGIVSFVAAMPGWIKDKLFMKHLLREELRKLQADDAQLPPLLFSEHHLSHAASAFYPSPFEEAAILTIDGVGEWATTTIGVGKGAQIQILKELPFPHSLDLLYSAFTAYCGFKVNSGEYKLMGFAPYGQKNSARVERFKQQIFKTLITLQEDGSMTLNMAYFEFATKLNMCNNERWEALFGIPPRAAESELTQEHADLALAIQEVCEEVVLRLAKTARAITGLPHLVLAGGVALNCVANEKIRTSNLFDRVWIQPAAGDAGGALGAAYVGAHVWHGTPRSTRNGTGDDMRGSYLGPEYSDLDVERMMRTYGAVAKKHSDISALTEDIAASIAAGKVIGWMQGRMEWGPRALGNRSILGDPRNPEMQKKLNLKIKYREGFRPFAPAVLAEHAQEYFECSEPSPYMLFTAPVATHRRHALAPASAPLFERLYTPRSDLPAITHLDYSARIQTVSRDTNEPFWLLLQAFRKQTGCAVLINTSFNVRNEPIVCTPEDAYRCFMNTEMDRLVIGNYVFTKDQQPAWTQNDVTSVYGLD